MTLDRRKFIKAAAAQAGLFAAGVDLAGGAPAAGRVPGSDSPGRLTGIPDVAVIGAGAFGGWAALHIRRLGAAVDLVDAYGPGNSRATSGDETRGIRSSYGIRRPHWVSWAKEAIAMWRAWDEEWRETLGIKLFFTTGDLILRPDVEALEPIRKAWDEIGAAYEILDMDEVARQWPVFRTEDLEAAIYEPDAGVGRSRRTCEAVAAQLARDGGRVVIGRAEPGEATGRVLRNVLLDGERPLAAGQFVFACGPWLPGVFPELLGRRIRIPMGHVYYFGTPPGDSRFTYPNLPSWGLPGVTGWPALGPDNRGFRVRTGGRQQPDPDTSVRWIPESYHDAARRVLSDRFPRLVDMPIVETRACHYDSSSSREFIIARHPDYDNVWIAGAGNAEGFKFGPWLGPYIADRVLGRPTDPEMDALFGIPEEEFEPPATGQAPEPVAESTAYGL